MKLSDYNYELPEELIAQKPLEDRSSSRLMVIHRDTGEIEHRTFKDIIEYLNKGDCLVLNDSKVIPARLYGENEKKALVEFLLLKRMDKDSWEVLCKPGKKAKIGSEFAFGNDKLKCRVMEITDQGNRIIKFEYSGVFEEILDELGEMPLPPYIHEKLEDKNRYQTVYAKEEGSSAAPTAGFHFTNDLLDKIKEKGVELVFITLHVGLGTFRPVKVENIEEHHMHSEYYRLTEEEADKINRCKKQGGKVIAVGTTSCRTLETIARNGTIKAQSGITDIFIYEGYEFKAIDGLITNFHIPESTLIMLVSAFYNRASILHAYEEAVKLKYRFYSFGDSMLIV